ncbi:hypothetical protein LUZ60_009654 [Juncus effusus]|nr:hypothetical protein LUZ60_009654 [Juncus effusus]
MPSIKDEPETLSQLRLLQPNNFRFDSIPDSHVWPNLHDHPVVDPVGPDSIPLINLTDSNLVRKVGKACEEWGVFQIAGHGINPDLLNRLESQIHRLFALPAHQKLRGAKSVGDLSGYGLVPISSFFSKFMWSEGFTICGSPLQHAQKLWPNDYTSFCEVMEEYNEAMKQLASRLLQVMLLSLGLTKEEINQTGPIRESNMSTAFQLNSYPVCPDPDRAIGLATHTDSGLLTLLYQNGISGLQVLRPKDDLGPTRWVTVPALLNTFIVNIGDLMQILSNGRFRSVLHRAVVNRVHHRISVGYFCGPLPDVQVSPFNKLTDPKQGPVYRAVTWPEYQKLRGKLFDTALESIKIYKRG